MQLVIDLKGAVDDSIVQMWRPFINDSTPSEVGDPEIEVVYFLWAGIKTGLYILLTNKVKS